MTYDTESTELAAVVSSGQKVDAKTQSAIVRKTKFSGVALSAAGQTGKLSERLPPNAEIIGVAMDESAGTGTVNVGLDTGTATSVATGIDPTTFAITPIDNVAAGAAEVYATAVGAAVTISGYILWTAGA